MGTDISPVLDANKHEMAWINSFEYHETVSLLRSFFLSRGFVETEVQSRRSILAACEDPHTITKYDYQ